MYTGTIIKESLNDESVLNAVTTSNQRIARIENIAPDQPPVWTLYTFAIEDSKADATAKMFSDSLKKGTWYIDMNNGADHYVVFAGRVFKNEEKSAKEYGRSLGIPEKQLAWKE